MLTTLNDLSLSTIVLVYNELAEKPVKAFKDKPTATARTQMLLDAGNYLLDTVPLTNTADMITIRSDLHIVPLLQQADPAPVPVVVDKAPKAKAAPKVKPGMDVVKALGLDMAKATPAGKAKAKAAGAAKAKAAKGDKATHPTAVYAETLLINCLVAANPKRGKSGARFQIILDRAKKGLTVGDYLDACVKLEGTEARPRYGYRSDLTKGVKLGRLALAK